MSIEKQRRWLKGMIADIDDAFEHAKDLDRAAFKADKKTIDAVERRLERIAEAAIRLDNAEDWKPNYDWADLRGLGNWLRHKYDAIQLDIIWDTVTINLPELRRECEAELARLDDADETE